MRPHHGAGAQESAGLTLRQTEVVELVAQGERTRDIARLLGISERAVTKHLTRLMSRYGAKNRAGLIAAVLAVGTPAAAAAHSRAPLSVPAGPKHIECYRRAPFLVAVTEGPDHVFTFVNDMWQRVMHLSARRVLGKPLREVFPHPSAKTYASRQRAFREGEPTAGNMWHYRWTQSDGKEREADFNYIYQPLYDARGEVAGLLMIATEVERRS